MSGAIPPVGVIGAGHWGKNHLRNFAALGALAAFADADAATVSGLAATYPNAKTFVGGEKLIDSGIVKAVVIASPAVTHGALARRALEAGLHVFVEKPLCLDVAEAESLRDLANRNGRVLMVGHLLLYHPAFLAMKRLVDTGVLGDLRYIYSNRLSLGKIRREENALWSFAPHDISMILALTGQLPSKVVATGGHYLDSKVADTTLSHLTFTTGVQAHVFVSWLHPYKDHRMVVVGSKAMAVFDDTRKLAEKVQLYRHGVGWNEDLPVVSRAEAEPVAIEDTEPLRVECETFLKCVATGSRPTSDAEEGIRVLRVLDACQRAIAAGAAVKLS